MPMKKILFTITMPTEGGNANDCRKNPVYREWAQNSARRICE